MFKVLCEFCPLTGVSSLTLVSLVLVERLLQASVHPQGSQKKNEPWSLPQGAHTLGADRHSPGPGADAREPSRPVSGRQVRRLISPSEEDQGLGWERGVPAGGVRGAGGGGLREERMSVLRQRSSRRGGGRERSLQVQKWPLQRPWGEHQFGIFVQQKEDQVVQDKRRKWQEA